MRAYFLNISEDEKKSIRDKQRSIYDGYQTMQPKGNMTPLTVGNYALDEGGVTVNSRGDVTEYKNTGINKPMKKMCEQCGSMYEGEMCENECKEGENRLYSEEQIEEGIKLKSKKDSVIKEINESLNWFKKLI